MIDHDEKLPITRRLLSQIAYAFEAAAGILEDVPPNGVFGTTARLIREEIGEADRGGLPGKRPKRQRTEDHCPVCGGRIKTVRRSMTVRRDD